VTDPAKRERAALDVLGHAPRMVGRRADSYDPGTGRWTYTARGPHPGRGKYPETITGTGEDELAAMTISASGSTSADAPTSSPIDRRGRAAFLEGAEAPSKAAEGRPLTSEELNRVTKRYAAS
jgi:hypothetical protein